MKSISIAVIFVALVTTACSGGTVSPSAVPSGPPVTTASPTTSPSSPLEGSWATGETTCAEQNAAVEAAGFTAEQMTLADWSQTCAEGMPHGSQFIIRFAAGRLLIFNDGEVGFSGLYRIVDDQTFEAGEAENGYYITYHFAIDGDQLTIDMIENDWPEATTPAELLGDQLAQTVIFETSPFTRQD